MSNIKEWEPQKLRRIPIPKKNGKARILSVPTMHDRIWQCLVKYAIEPAHEAMFNAKSYGFNFLGWHFKVQTNGKFRSTPSEENFKEFRKKVKFIVNNSAYGAKTKRLKLAPIVRGWRNYHRYCKMDGSRFALWGIAKRTESVFTKQKKISRWESIELAKKAFPSVEWKENNHVNVTGTRSPFDNDLIYWSKRNSKNYDGLTSTMLRKQDHICECCGLNFLPGEDVHLHHRDGNHSNWKHKNLVAIHRSCHQYIHMKQNH